jgi:hypothetical protein
MRFMRWTALCASAMLLMSCESSSNTTEPPVTPGGGDPVPQAQLNFLRPATGVALRTDSVSFWAVRGQNREVAMYYRPVAGSTDSVRFLRFRVRQEALLRRPNGTAFANGDSVKITIRILDLSKLITQFEPSGLVFDATRPAELRLDFRNADQDFNRDGVVNSADANAIATFAIWKQEALGQPWFKLSSLVEISGGLSEVKADIGSFTAHAIAY